MSTLQRPLRGALVGYGHILSQGHLPTYQKRSDVEIVAIADICEGRRAQASLAHPEARIYTHADILLEQEALNLDFVDIATPPAFHAEIALAALGRGLHVLCEKPLTSTVEEAESLLKKAAETRRVIFPVHNFKHAPVIKAVRSVLDSAAIGRVTSVSINTFRNAHTKGALEWRPHWRRETQLSGGGIAMDHGGHALYLAFDWLGAYPTSVTAKMSNLSGGNFDTEDNASLVLTFPNGIADIHLSWTAGMRKVIYAIQGERGAIRVDDDEMEILRLREGDGWDTERRTIPSQWMDSSHAGWFNSLFDQFRDTILKGDYVGKEAKEALLCAQVVHAAYLSAADQCREQSLPS